LDRLLILNLNGLLLMLQKNFNFHKLVVPTLNIPIVLFLPKGASKEEAFMNLL
jgi:hypothetical protein